MVTQEEYRRLEGFVGELELDRPRDEPLLRYVLVNFALLGAGLAAWTAMLVGLNRMLI